MRLFSVVKLCIFFAVISSILLFLLIHQVSIVFEHENKSLYVQNDKGKYGDFNEIMQLEQNTSTQYQAISAVIDEDGSFPKNPQVNVADIADDSYSVNVKKMYDRLIIEKQTDPNFTGEMGRPMIVNVSQLSPEDQEWYNSGYENHGFNQYASDHMSLQRSWKENRDKECLNQTYKLDPTFDTSVIVIFYNEALSPLLRTAYSVINKTPPHLLREVILVDDGSTFEELKQPLSDFVDTHLGPKVRVIRNPKRLGLMQARMHGAEVATGVTLTFLDSHCECTEGWLEPLLASITENETNVVMPVIDIIHSDDFSLERVPGNGMGGFDWSLHFEWMTIPPREYKRRLSPTDPFWSPTMAGCIFTIHRNFFKKLGYYDPEFRIYGAENLEISFKIWMCHGKLLQFPCSHIAHMFRLQTPYLLKNNTHSFMSEMRNKRRLAEVWMDGFKHYYYEMYHYRRFDYGDISERVALRHNLKCHSFEWYLKNIYPEHYVPEDHLLGGEIKNRDTLQCLDASFPGLHPWYEADHLPVGTKSCQPVAPESQIFALGAEDGRLRCDEFCLIRQNSGNLIFLRCKELETFQHTWTYTEQNQLVHDSSGMCLDLDSDGKTVILSVCAQRKRTQIWKAQRKETRPI